MIFGNSEKQNLLEDLPVSLTYEIAGCSRISQRQKLGRRFAQSAKMQSVASERYLNFRSRVFEPSSICTRSNPMLDLTISFAYPSL